MHVTQLFLRKLFDLISGYKHKPIPPNSNMSVEELIKGGYILSDKQWLSVSVRHTVSL